MSLTQAQRTTRARKAAFAMHAKHDSRRVTEAARKAFMKKFEDQVDPEGLLPLAERLRQAAILRRQYFNDLTRLSLIARGIY